MTGALALFGVWVGFSTAAVGLLLWAANHETQADLPSAEPHHPATCPACLAATDAVLARFDFDLWGIEMQEPAS